MKLAARRYLAGRLVVHRGLAPPPEQPAKAAPGPGFIAPVILRQARLSGPRRCPFRRPSSWKHWGLVHWSAVRAHRECPRQLRAGLQWRAYSVLNSGIQAANSSDQMADFYAGWSGW